MMRKALTILLAALLLLSVLPLSAAAKTVKSGTCGVIDADNDPDGDDVIWTLDDKGVLTISGKGAFDLFRSEGETPNEEEVKSLVVNTGVTALPDAVFYRYAALEEVNLPDTLTAIGSAAFQECESLKEIKIPDSVTTLGESAFLYCYALEEATLSDKLETIPNSLFSGCSALKTIHLPKNLKTIGVDAFNGCRMLEKAELPASANRIGDGAFHGCEALRLVTIPANDVRLQSSPFDYNYNGLLQIGCMKGSEAETYAQDYDIPFYFLNADNSIPLRVGKAKGTLDRKSGVLTIQCNGVLPDFEYFGDTPWADGSKLNKYIRSIVIEDGCTAIGSFEFKDLKALTSVTLPESVLSIGDGAFSGCTALETVRLPKNLQTIGNSVFFKCEALKAVDLPQTLESIGKEAFYGCAALTEVTIPAGVKEFGDDAFSFSGLRSVVLSEGLTETGRGLFNGCADLQSVQVPESMKFFGFYCFSNCPALESLTVPAGMEKFYTLAIEYTALPLLIIKNPNCVFVDEYENFIKEKYLVPIDLNTVICGYEGSTAEAYADKNGQEFRSLGNAPTKLGDVNLDGEVTAADARLALRAAVGLETLTDAQKTPADVDHDFDITAADARLILRAAVGLEVLK